MSTAATAEKKAWYSSFETFTRENEVARNEMYLSFRLVDNDFGIEVTYVVEVIGMKKITELPQMPVFIKGIIDYRGSMILVADLRIYLDLPPRSSNDFAFIIVINYQNELIGLIVDNVNEVRSAKREELVQVRSKYGRGKMSGQENRR